MKVPTGVGSHVQYISSLFSPSKFDICHQEKTVNYMQNGCKALNHFVWVDRIALYIAVSQCFCISSTLTGLPGYVAVSEPTAISFQVTKVLPTSCN